MRQSRRGLIRAAIYGATSIAITSPLIAFAAAARRNRVVDVATPYGPLAAPDSEGLRLPPGFSGRCVARAGQAPIAGGRNWHAAPDGAVCVPNADSGWSYISNSELEMPDGGVSAIDFDSRGEPRGIRQLLAGAARPCAGGLFGTAVWLACEEVPNGIVWEVEVHGRRAPVQRQALGVFNHEAAAWDPNTGCIYLTEDEREGGLYRFTPARADDLSAGQLDVLAGAGTTLRWASVPDPRALHAPTRKQVPDMVRFNGGEGAWFAHNELSFTSKGDDRVWVYTPARNALAVLYDGRKQRGEPLRGVDNLVQDPAGVRYVAEDGGDMQICIVDRTGHAHVLAQLVGVRDSEITGLAFAPAGDRLYFSSQRNPGATYEIRGSFTAAL